MISLKMIILGLVLLIPLASSTVVINEIELKPPESGSMWAELYNPGDQGIDISGWSVTITDGGWVGRMSVPQGTIIAADGFYVVEGNPLWNHDDGGYATLYNQDGEKVDESPYLKDTLNNDFTWGRHPDGYDTNTEGDWGFSYATKGRSNQI